MKRMMSMGQRWDDYLNEISIAEDALQQQKLYHASEDLLCDFFTIPSHNHYCFYARIYQSERLITYVRTEIYDPVTGTVIKMYSFSDARKAGKRGRIICGERKLEQRAMESLQAFCDVLPVEVVPGEDNGIVLDGVTQLIRVYEDGTVVKRALFMNGNKPIIGDLYLLLEKQIRG